MKNNKLEVFFPNLDALRFLCFIAVFGYHAFATKYDYIQQHPVYDFIEGKLFGNGDLGVNFFFVLSGFLITYLLLAEKHNYQSIHVGKFYLRRMLKIWPLYYFCIFFGFVLFPIFKTLFGALPEETASPWMYLSFLSNIDIINKGLPDASVLSILWSISIEEQFYLFWPLLFAAIPVRYLPFSFLFLVFASFTFRLIYVNEGFMRDWHTFSCISDMTIGGLGAYFCFYSEPLKQFIVKMPCYVIASVYLAVGSVFLFRTQIFSHHEILIALGRLIISLLFLFVILEQNYSKHSIFKLQRLKIISRLGKYTYGLYCWHMIAMLVVATLLDNMSLNTKLWQVLFLEPTLALGLNIVLAYASYHLYEKHFLKLKSRFSPVKSGQDVRRSADRPYGATPPSLKVPYLMRIRLKGKKIETAG